MEKLLPDERKGKNDEDEEDTRRGSGYLCGFYSPSTKPLPFDP